MTKRATAHRIFTRGPSDTSELERLFEGGHVAPEHVLAILGKTEGNGGRNDFTRELTTRALADCLAPRLGIARAEVEDRVVLSLSGGCEGVVAPHLTVLAVQDGAPAPLGGQKRLAVGIGHTREFEPEEIGRMPQIEETARVVREVAASVVAAPEDVRLVQMKGAIPEADYGRAEAARRAGAPLRNDMVHSRGASALGVALALGEVEPGALGDEVVCSDYRHFSGVASCSAKPKLRRTEVLMVANSASWSGEFVAAHGILEDILDAGGVARVLGQLGITVPVSKADRERIVGVFAKSEADPRREIRGRRHVMLDDDDVSDTRYSRCALAAVIASVVGDTGVYVSTRAEHHGPLGGGPLAIIARA